MGQLSARFSRSSWVQLPYQAVTQTVSCSSSTWAWAALQFSRSAARAMPERLLPAVPGPKPSIPLRISSKPSEEGAGVSVSVGVAVGSCG